MTSKLAQTTSSIMKRPAAKRKAASKSRAAASCIISGAWLDALGLDPLKKQLQIMERKLKRSKLGSDQYASMRQETVHRWTQDLTNMRQKIASLKREESKRQRSAKKDLQRLSTILQTNKELQTQKRRANKELQRQKRRANTERIMIQKREQLLESKLANEDEKVKLLESKIANAEENLKQQIKRIEHLEKTNRNSHNKADEHLKKAIATLQAEKENLQREVSNLQEEKVQQWLRD